MIVIPFGIDVSKNTLDVGVIVEASPLTTTSKQFKNSPQGHQQLITWLDDILDAPKSHWLAVLEATSVYHVPLLKSLTAHGIGCSLVNPAHAHYFAKSQGWLHKTDKNDAKLLAQYGHFKHQTLHRWQAKSETLEQLESLNRRLKALQTDRRRELNRREKAEFIGATLELASIDKLLTVLDEELECVEQHIMESMTKDSAMQNHYQHLNSIPGVGFVLSSQLLPILLSRTFTSARQLAAFVGVVPQHQQSGRSLNKPPRMSKSGNPYLRGKLYMAALVASQHNPELKAFYQNLLQRGKSKMAALGAVMRKLLHICYGVFKNQQMYLPQKHKMNT